MPAGGRWLPWGEEGAFCPGTWRGAGEAVSAPFSGRCMGLGSPDSSGEPGLALLSLGTPLGWAGTGARAPAGRSLMEAQARRPVPASPRPGSPSLKDRTVALSAGQNAVSTLVGTQGPPATSPNTQSVFKLVGQAGRGCGL